MTQIAAEELSVPLDQVEVIQGDTALTPDQGVTFGSLSIQVGGMQIRQAAATARETLITEGAKKLGGIVRRDNGALGPRVRMKEQDVRCVYVEGAGCYGRNGHEDAAADAALIAQEIGKPVRVQWMRADEHGCDPKGPPTLLDYRSALDAGGNLVAWESEVFIPDRPSQIQVTLVAADLAQLPKEAALDWASYPILTFPDVPEVAIDLIERPWGAGEPTAAVVPSAIANAIYDALGVRLRSVPFTPDKVLAALKTA